VDLGAEERIARQLGLVGGEQAPLGIEAHEVDREPLRDIDGAIDGKRRVAVGVRRGAATTAPLGSPGAAKCLPLEEVGWFIAASCCTMVC
jgi:hypothetical protein